MSDFLQLAGKTIVVCGVANKKSVAWHTAQVLSEAGAEVVYVVRSPARCESLLKLLAAERDKAAQRARAAAAESPQGSIDAHRSTDALGGDHASASAELAVYVCDVEFPEQIETLGKSLADRHPRIHGLVHSLAYADYFPDLPFHETPKAAFLRAVDISCFSLTALANALRPLFAEDASVVTISISTTRMASENYGYMAPIKAALDSSVVFLAKSFSRFSQVRFNAVCPGLLKTSASAGIPGYVDAYLYAEQATLRKAALRTEEVASTVAFLLSPRSSGINAQRLVIDAGMEVNYFDRELIARAGK